MHPAMKEELNAVHVNQNLDYKMNNSKSNNCDLQMIAEHYEKYSLEYQKCIVSLEQFNSKTKDLIIESYQTCAENKLADIFSKLQIYMKIIKKVNQDLSDVYKAQCLPVVSSNTFESLDDDCDANKSVSIVHSLPAILHSEIDLYQAKIKQNELIDHEHPSYHFKYPQPEIHLYTKDHEGICIISYVRKCEYKKSFFIVDNSMIKSTHIQALSKLANLSFELKVHPNWIPNVGHVFGVFIDNCLFRAVKQTKAEENDPNFKVLLIDIGEIFDIEINKNDLYDLPNDVRIIPAQGLYCILDRKSTITIDNVKDGIYKERTFRITKIKKSTFHVDGIKEITNPFYTDLVSEKIVGSKVYKTSVANTSINVSYQNTSSSDEFTLNSSDTESKKSCTKSSKVTDTDQQPAFIENKTTSSAIEAVMTFRPTDDQRVCHFYNHQTRSCFKGPNCKLQHLPPVEGGWSRDKIEIKTAIANEIEYPVINSFITVIPTSIELDGSFWCQIEIGSQTDSLSKLKQLNLKLNSPEFVLNYKELDHFPVNSELVLAQYHCDGLWYRGRIIGDYDQRFKVFFLDYGNCDFVNLDKIRKWDNRCDYLPFQAILCRIANISFKQGNLNRIFEVLAKLILNKRMTAIVLNNLSDLDVVLMDSNGEDVGDQLVEQNLATSKKQIKPVHGINNNPVPQ